MRRSTHTATLGERGLGWLTHSAMRACVLGVPAAALAALAACSSYSVNDGKVRLTGSDRVSVSPQYVDRYSCDPTALVCESVSGGGRLTERQCECMGPTYPAKLGMPASPTGRLGFP
jgi:hypothetical protein